MSEEQRYDKPFSHPRWHEPMGGEVIGHKELSEEKQKKAHEDTVAVLKSWGIEIKPVATEWQQENFDTQISIEKVDNTNNRNSLNQDE